MSFSKDVFLFTFTLIVFFYFVFQKKVYEERTEMSLLPTTLLLGTDKRYEENSFGENSPNLPLAPRAGTPENPRLIRMCLMLPVKTLPLKTSDIWESIGNTQFLSIALPSVLDTTLESDNMEYIFLVAFNHDDIVYGNEEFRKIASQITADLIGNRTDMHIFLRPVYMTTGTTVIWNILAAWGYDIGCDYFVPANDDLAWRSDGWSRMAVELLRNQKNKNCPNFGLVGLTDPDSPGFAGSPTFHIVSRLHVHIHSRSYYPVKMLGFGVDPWIWFAYAKLNAAVMSKDIIVTNKVSAFFSGKKLLLAVF